MFSCAKHFEDGCPICAAEYEAEQEKLGPYRWSSVYEPIFIERVEPTASDALMQAWIEKKAKEARALFAEQLAMHVNAVHKKIIVP